MVALNLRKGGGLKLEKRWRFARVGLSWDAAPPGERKRDGDVTAVALNAERRVPGTEWVVVYAQPNSPNGEMTHSGDEKAGTRNGDDETIAIDLVALPDDITEVAILATIHDGQRKGQDWAQFNAKATLYDRETDEALAVYPLGQDYAGQTAVHVVSLYRDGDLWRFEAMGAGTTKTLGAILSELGAEIESE